MSPFSSIRITRPSAGLFSKGMDTGATRRQVMVRLAQTMRVVLGDLKKKHESKMFANKNGWAMNHPSNLLGVRSGKLKKSFTHGVKTEGSVVQVQENLREVSTQVYMSMVEQYPAARICGYLCRALR